VRRRTVLALLLILGTPAAFAGEPMPSHGMATGVGGADHDGSAAKPPGIVPAHGKATGFFHVEQLGGVWWLIDPDGRPFFSKGVNFVSFAADYSPALHHSPYQRAAEAKYGGAGKWAAAIAARLHQLGFNTVGPWSSPEMLRQGMPYAIVARLTEGSGADWQKGKVADVFAPAFEASVRKRAQKICAPQARDPLLVGYFTDNEMRWGRDWRAKTTLLEEFMTMAPSSPGRQAAVRVLRAKYGTVEAFNRAWATKLRSLDDLAEIKALPMTNEAARQSEQAFQREYARTYFKIAHDAIRAADPNHLILGCRFAGYAPADVAAMLGQFADVASINTYVPTAPLKRLQSLAESTRLPVLVSEFSFTAADSGLPNKNSGSTPLKTQNERALHYEAFVRALAKAPYVVGFHWFQWADQPASGRPDGSSSNFGIVNVKDEPWPALAASMERVNSTLEELHANSAAKH
jgi:hypothetical protein